MESDLEKPEKSGNRFMTPLKSKTPHKKKRPTSNGEDTIEKSATAITSPVVPLTRKNRRSLEIRTKDDQVLQKVGEDATLFFDDTRTQSATRLVSIGTNSLGKLMDDRPFAFLVVAAASIVSLKQAGSIEVILDLDIALLIVFISFCFGLNIPRTLPNNKAAVPTIPPKQPFAARPGTSKSRELSRDASFTIRRAMLVSPRASFVDNGQSILKEEASAEVMEGEDDPLFQSPMLEFPKGAPLGSHFNCWSQPSHTDFKVRGSNYLQDKKKIPSGPFVFPARGVDLFLTDSCPENIGSNSGVLGGALRTKPTFLINFRLPWGVLVFYFEIPDIFLPFLRKKYEFDYNGALPDMTTMTPAERTTCRFLMADQAGKDAVLKIVPIVIAGPWIVKSVVGGKPAILGTKLPVNYIYQKPEGTKALYLEADLDIVASSAARGILSVCRSHTQSLTLDLGFVVQGNQQDELPEQMLVGVRCHGIDPLNAPPLPPMKNTFFDKSLSGDTLGTD
mmetsp:Transcript_38672/g.54443  ORF Transcript_38672/g.54443 Transcript_38672/m.54443 type:complete len:505 (-) Transcript_38672:527-2041(-)